MSKNVVLIGMPASGKSTIGVLLAKILNKGFVDTDILMQSKYGKSLKDIISEDGIYEFKTREKDTIMSIDTDNSVIATGGSAVYSKNAMEHLKKNSVFVYIYVPYCYIKERIESLEERGVLLEEDRTLSELYDSRQYLYEKYADITINAKARSVEDLLKEIIEKTRDLD